MGFFSTVSATSAANKIANKIGRKNNLDANGPMK